jgi:hypothetical protein
MSQIPQFKRIVVENFPKENQELVSKLAYSINVFANNMTSALTNNLSIQDNLNIKLKTFVATVDSSGNITGNSVIKTDLDHNCLGVSVIKATNLTTVTHYPTGTPFISFSETQDGFITIGNITNLTAGEPYQLQLLLF